MILASIVIVKYIDLSESTKIQVCKSNQATLESAQKMYYAVNAINGNGTYAETLEQLIPYVQGNTIPSCPQNGVYQIDANFHITCSISEHQR